MTSVVLRYYKYS